MIDLQDLRSRPDAYQKAAHDKNIDVSIDDFLKLDEKRKALLPEIEEMRAKKNDISKKVPRLKDSEKKIVMKEMKQLNDELKKKEDELVHIEKDWKAMQLSFPSIPLDTTPIGKNESDNVEIEKWGDPSAMLGDSPPKKISDHVTLGEALDIIDIPGGVKVGGARSYLLKGDGARLEQAVLQYTMNHLVQKGFTIISPPVLAGYDVLRGMGHFPGSEEQTYAIGVQREKGGEVEGDELYLVGTSEPALLASRKDEILSAKDLSLRMAGISPCFRREAGTYGKDTKGLYRVHQFQKVEQVVFCEADQEVGLKMFEEIRTNALEILHALKLPYRIVNCCTGDMGQGKVVMHDIETWMPSRDSYGETHSCSYLGDFQARRLNIKYEDSSGEKKFVHTLNNTCIASPRILIPILEMYQNADGSVTVPEVLRPYMQGQSVIAST